MIYNASLDSLDLTGCGNLETLAANNCALTSLTLTGCGSLLNISVPNNLLTSLDLSASGGYDYIYVQGNSISSITIAEGTSYVSDRPDYNLSTNSLSNTSIDEFFTSLGDGLYYDDTLGTINVSGNIGSATCDTLIATEKNWSPTV
jgi:hypothetical protein